MVPPSPALHAESHRRRLKVASSGLGSPQRGQVLGFGVPYFNTFFLNGTLMK